ncbi:MFS transporter [Nocardia terpenica]|uniref:MFS transporter n=1 Tax=Nocardia terpenica TaxID=455432 RepID=A0A164NXW5_9NOCA|nr:MFS transporter [Nocardia terpenica]KZM74861.1 hypothetical protein AWN90_22815 [Nocardia terpenica]
MHQTPTRLTPRFRRFLLIRLISLLGSAMTPAALALAVLTASHRLGDLGFVLAAQLLPHLALLVIGGVVGDRCRRRIVLMAANFGAGLTQAAVAAVLLTGHYSLSVVACLELANGALEAFAAPALRAIVPELVGAGALQRANSLLTGTKNATKIAGPMVAGILVATVGGGWAIAVDAATFLVAAALLSGMSLDAAMPTARTGGVLADLRDGWRAFRGTQWVWVTTLSFFLINLCVTGVWQILGPALTGSRDGAFAWGLVLGIRAVGLLAMTALMFRYTLRHLLRAGQLAGACGGCALLALGLHADLPWLLACAFIAGMGFTAVAVAWEVSVQQHIPRDLLSRVGAYSDLLSYTAIPIGQLLVAPAATWWGADHVALGSGIAFAAAALAPLLSPAVRNLRTHPTPTTVAGGRLTW